MSTIKSSNDHLTLNADGTSKDIKFQADGVEKASISSAGLFTSTTIDATKLTGNLPAISGASLTGIDGVPAGVSLGVANNDTYVGTGDTTVQFVDGSDVVIPTGTNGAQRSDLVSLGDANNRFKDIYISGGLRVGGTATANALDDYEEGDCSVTLNGSSSGNNSLTGKYIKIGNVVKVQARGGPFSSSSFGGNAVLSNLPFTIGSSELESYQPTVLYGLNTAYTHVTYWHVNPPYNYCVLYEARDGTDSATITNSQFGTTYIRATITYRTN